MGKIEEENAVEEVLGKKTEKEADEPNIIEICSPPNISENFGSNGSSKTEIIEAKNELNTNARFEKRIQNLQNMMAKLREKLKQEKELLRKEFDETNKLQMKMIEHNSDILIDLKPDFDTPVSLDCDLDLMFKRSLLYLDNEEIIPNNATILEYEKILSQYKEALAAFQAKKHQNLWHQIAVTKKNVMEVEQLCSEEIVRVRQCVSHLEPLNKIAPEWKHPKQSRSLSFTHMSSNLDVSFMQERHFGRDGEISGPDIKHFSAKIKANVNVQLMPSGEETDCRIIPYLDNSR